MVDKFEAWRFRNTVLAEESLEVWGDIKGKVAPAEHLAGAIGTLGAPVTTRQIIDGVIVKTIKIDLDGFAVLGTQAKDAIALVGGLAAIGRYVIATDGVCFKIEMACISVPTSETATITQDIDLGADDDGTILQGGDPIDDIKVNTAALVAGEIAVQNAPALTDLDYIFLIEGDTTASTGEYAGGQFIIKFYGHPLLT
jgi:hypothetical protein